MAVLAALGPPEYFAISVFFAIMLIVSGRSLLPDARFRALAPRLEKILSEISSRTRGPFPEADMSDVLFRLQKFKINLPRHAYERTFPLLIALSRNGELKKARKVDWGKCSQRTLTLSDVEYRKGSGFFRSRFHWK